MAKTKISSGGIADDAVTVDTLPDTSITNAKLAGSITNAKLTNDSVTYNSQTVALGASGTIDTYTDVLSNLYFNNTKP
jgi:hypothetical protein